jgi:Ca-activated chloride channel homolog
MRRGRWLLKGLSAVCVAAALFEPELNVDESKVAVVALADTSASVADADLARESQMIRQMAEARGRNDLQVVPFASVTRPAELGEQGKDATLRRTAGEAGRGTNLETAIREAAALVSEHRVPRVVLMSDGLENRGSVARAAWLARQSGIPVDTIALNGRPKPRLNLVAARLPGAVFAGEKFPIELEVESPEKARAAVELHAEGKTLVTSQIDLQPGSNLIRASTSLAVAGAFELGASVNAGTLGKLDFSQAITLRRPRLLYVSQDLVGMDQHLLGALAAAQFEITSANNLSEARLEDFQIVILNNFDYTNLGYNRKSDLEKYVQQGGGLLIIGGERNVYVDRKNAEPDPLERALPANVAPPRSPEGTLVVLIVDKSSSMEGRKMELARLAAIGVIDNLRTIDSVGVLIFDNSHQWAVPVRRAEDRTLIKRLIAGITPDGGTQIAPALTEAYKRTVAAQGAFKHIVLLTDGISEEGDSMTVAREAAANRVTISTVGLGQDVNRGYLEKVAQFAKGKAYFLTDPSGLEQILLKDVQEHTGSTTVEKTLSPVVLRQVEILDGIPMASAPILKGYVRFIAKPAAESILALRASPSEEDPLLARWQYGLGRTAVFTSDAKSRWAEAWVGWPGFDRFWSNVVRDLLPHAQAGDAGLSYDAATGELGVEYRLARGVTAPATPPAIFAMGPDGFQSAVEVKKVAEGLYRGRVHTGARQGLFRVRPLAESRLFPEAGLYRPEEETHNYGNNVELLKQLSTYTGGRHNPSPAQVFDAGGRSIPATLPLWPALLGLAVVLNLGELAWRKLRGDGTILHTRPAETAPTV